MHMLKHVSLVATVVLALAGTLLVGSGCNKDDSGSTGVGSVITVSGKVVGPTGQPVVGIPVFVGTSPSVVSDASGNFTIPNVTTPYTITAVDGLQKIGIVFIGLTRSDPVLTFFLTPSGTSLTATLSGTISGGANFPEPVNHKTITAFVSPEVAATSTASTVTGIYNISPNWFGPTTTTGTLHALQWQFDANGLPVTYKGYGTKTGIALSNGGTFGSQNVAMSPIAPLNVSGSVVPPAGYTVTSKSAVVLLGTAGGITIVTDPTATTTFTYNTPTIAGATLRLQGAATKSPYQSAAFKIGVPLNGTGQTITIPASPEYSLPVAAATGVTTNTDFAWTAFAGGVHLVLFTGGAGQPSYQVVTAATTAKIPNLTSVGLPLPAAAGYSWRIIGISPFASIDQAAGAGLFSGIVAGATVDGAFGLAGFSGGARTFTTAP
jgi:hypothetical protein